MMNPNIVFRVAVRNRFEASTGDELRARIRLMHRFSPARALRLLLASSLSLWIAGAGCMLGCDNMTAMGADRSEPGHQQAGQSTLVASGDACAAREGNASHSCCKKGGVKAQSTVGTAAPNFDGSLLEVQGSSSGTMNGCPLAMGRAAVIAKTQNGDSRGALALEQSQHTDLVSSERTAPLSQPLRLPNRGHTYLRCCVFLI